MADITDTVRGAYTAFAKGDIPAVLAVLDPQVSWTEADGFPYGGTYSGPDAVLEGVFVKLGAEWDGYSAVAHEFVTQGGHRGSAWRIQRRIQSHREVIQGTLCARLEVQERESRVIRPAHRYRGGPEGPAVDGDWDCLAASDARR